LWTSFWNLIIAFEAWIATCSLHAGVSTSTIKKLRKCYVPITLIVSCALSAVESATENDQVSPYRT
jgi:hypothetical protein